MDVPPALVFLFRSLPALLIRPTITYLVLRASQQILNVELPGWVVGSLTVLSSPLGIYVSMLSKERRDERAAAAHGAILGNKVEGTSLDNMRALQRMSKFGYPGECYNTRPLERSKECIWI